MKKRMGITKNSNTHRVIPTDMLASERVALALSLRRQCMTYEEIAVKCGYANKGAAYNAIKNALKKTIVVAAKEYRQRELEILDEIHQKIWPLITDPTSVDMNHKPDLWAVDRILKVSEARRQLLNLDEKPEDTAKSYTVVRLTPPGYFGALAPQGGPNESGS